MPDQDPNESCTQLILGAQRRLYAYILAFVPNKADADDVLQETNSVLLRKANTFQPGSDFWLWSSKVAYFEVLNYRKRRQRNQTVLAVDEDVLQTMAHEATEAFADVDERLLAMRQCLEKVAPTHRELIRFRYQQELSAEQIAAKVGRTPLAVRQVLFRIRDELSKCISMRLAAKGAL